MTTPAFFASKEFLMRNILLRVAHRGPHHIALLDEQRRMTYQELLTRVYALAGWLQKQGVQPGDKVAFMMRNSHAFVEVFYAIAFVGCVGVPINFRLTETEVEYIVAQSDSTVFITDGDYVDMIASMNERLRAKLRLVSVGQSDAPTGIFQYESIVSESCSYTQNDDLRDEDDFLIMYTSGTTGRPKGAVLTHKNLYVNAMNLLYEIQFPTDFKQIIIPPLFHIASLSTMIISGITGGTTVIHREFVPSKIYTTIEAEGINTLFMVPAMWNFLLQGDSVSKYDISSMRKCITGGAPCPLQVKERMMASFPQAGIYDAFGQTETSPVVSCLKSEDTLLKTTSVGKSVINVELRVVDNNMNDVPVGEVGEAVYRGPVVMKEYYKNEQATRDAFEGGWFHSGDLVQMDEDGFIYIVDRKKDMIISGGENIYSTEVEEALYSNPKVLEAAVVGVPDELWGEAVKAFVVLKPGQQATAEEIVSHCLLKLASYKKPKIIEFVESLPRNASGKVLKRLLRD